MSFEPVPKPEDYAPGTAADKAVDDVRVALDDEAVKDVISDVAPLIKETKDGWKTTEFWLTLAGLAAVNLNGVVMTLPDKYQAIGSAVVIGLYALSRGAAKKGIPAVEAPPEA
jgi:hypothetical protein